jgi:hypothetical protein
MLPYKILRNKETLFTFMGLFINGDCIFFNFTEFLRKRLAGRGRDSHSAIYEQSHTFSWIFNKKNVHITSRRYIICLIFCKTYAKKNNIKLFSKCNMKISINLFKFSKKKQNIWWIFSFTERKFCVFIFREKFNFEIFIFMRLTELLSGWVLKRLYFLGKVFCQFFGFWSVGNTHISFNSLPPYHLSLIDYFHQDNYFYDCHSLSKMEPNW